LKQRISVEDVRQLTPEQQEKLREWWNEPKIGDTFVINRDSEIRSVDSTWRLIMISNTPLPERFCPMLSIGQCIDLLEKSGRFKGLHKSGTDGEYKVYLIPGNNNGWGEYIKSDKELIVALFEAVKEIL